VTRWHKGSSSLDYSGLDRGAKSNQIAGMPPRCPACVGANLVDAPAGAERVLACAACGGRWLDLEASRHVVAGLLAGVESTRGVKSPERSADNPYRPLPRSPDVTRECIECGERMQATALGELGITLDTCARHGTWFDAGELARVARWFADQGVRLDEAGDSTIDPITLGLLQLRDR
jgi:Zn-finger nucleic acid-binding protein